ncbi:MAG TPA: plastocyanin/azurin family copper-binding protein [Azonexus sp.]|nr:plastocyanin/azurin family copper-binding protein [Azonexus sp.]
MAEVGIAGYKFGPLEVSIKVGDSVRWTNHEKRTSHSVVFPAEGGLESPRMFPDESWVRRFEKPGRYDYHCGPHPEMKGVVVVGE